MLRTSEVRLQAVVETVETGKDSLVVDEMAAGLFLSRLVWGVCECVLETIRDK